MKYGPKWNSKRCTVHHRIYRHLDFYLNLALKDTYDLLDIEQIRTLLKDKTGFFLNRETIKNYNKRYREKCGMGPLCQYGDLYKLNRCLHEIKQIRPPRGYKMN